MIALNRREGLESTLSPPFFLLFFSSFVVMMIPLSTLTAPFSTFTLALISAALLLARPEYLKLFKLVRLHGSDVN